MNRYTILSVLTVPAGALVALTAAQAATRAHALQLVERDEQTGGGVFTVVSPVQFKASEELGTNLEVNKLLATMLAPVQDAKSAKKKA